MPFKLIGSIPDMSAYDTYEYIFTDTLSDGLTLETDRINVYIAINKNDEVREYVPLTEGEHYTLNTDNVGANGGGSFTISFDDLKTAPYVNEENRNYVIVTYDATLNANAVIGLPGNPNDVYLEFSNNPNGNGKAAPPRTLLSYSPISWTVQRWTVKMRRRCCRMPSSCCSTAVILR